ncbi:hypothetical protein ACFPIJ_40875 [Dactylosporangium cerinum]|uniref:PBS lyase HEAT domain protein repeat-containing protein n=1 Tax=Dactylosporangium cerinum TaxID=1434730 RepID=A0ABV9W674_9ACTN
MINDFDDLAAVDWSALGHAWGAAGDVPDMLRRLVGPDPAERDDALRELHGVVHRDGEVFDSTVAAVPFLLAAAGDAHVPGRAGVLQLLAGIGGAFRLDDPAAEFHAARAAVAAAGPLFLRLLSDVDPDVRRAAPAVFLVGRGDAGLYLAALRDRLAVEPDPGVRGAIAAAIAGLGSHATAGLVSGIDPAEVGAWFSGWLSTPALNMSDVRCRITAVADVAHAAPDTLTGDLIPAVVDLVRADLPAVPPMTLPTLSASRPADLVHAMTELRSSEPRRAADSGDALVSELSQALNGRIEDRISLLTGLLSAGEPAARRAALRPAKALMGYWRGDYEALVVLVGAQLADARLAGRSALVLEHLDALAAPAVDALAAAVASAPLEDRYGDGPTPWIVSWPREGPTVGPTVWALAALHDARALPAVRAIVERDVLPRNAAPLAARYAVIAPDLLPAVRRRCAELTGSAAAGHHRVLAATVAALGPAAVEATPDLLALPLDLMTATALGRIGPGATAAVPPLRAALDCGHPVTEVAAALALWQITGDPKQTVQVLARHLSDPEYVTAAAADAAGQLGPAAADLDEPLRAVLDADADHALVAAARALWRVSGDADTSLPVLAQLWTDSPRHRADVAAYLSELGGVARPMRDLVEAELSYNFRHSAAVNGWSSNQVAMDLALLRDSRTILARTG